MNNNKQKYLKVKDNKSLVRDTNTKAILNIDKSARMETRRKRATMRKSLQNDSKRIDSLEKDVSEMKSILSDIHSLLTQKENK